MACSSCNRNGSSPTQVVSRVFNTNNSVSKTPCDITEEEIQTLLERLRCYQKKKRSMSMNKPLSFILTMINTKDFCRYNMDEIKALLDGENC